MNLPDPDQSPRAINEEKLNHLEAQLQDDFPTQSLERGRVWLEEAERLRERASEDLRGRKLEQLLPEELAIFLGETRLLHGEVSPSGGELISALRTRLLELATETDDLTYDELRHQLDDFEFEVKQAGGIESWIEVRETRLEQAAELHQIMGDIFSASAESIQQLREDAYALALMEREVLRINESLAGKGFKLEDLLVVAFLLERCPREAFPALKEELESGISLDALMVRVSELVWPSLSPLVCRWEREGLFSDPVVKFVSNLRDRLTSPVEEPEPDRQPLQSEVRAQEHDRDFFYKLSPQVMSTMLQGLSDDDFATVTQSSPSAKEMYIFDTMRSYSSRFSDMCAGVMLALEWRSERDSFLGLSAQYFSVLPKGSRRAIGDLLDLVFATGAQQSRDSSGA